MRKKKKELFNEFTVLGVFVAVSIIGFLYGGLSLIIGRLSPVLSQSVPVQQVAPTVFEYQDGARDVLLPFLDQARTMTLDEVVSADGAFTTLVDITQARLLEMRVPSEMRDAHLTFVLLLDQWTRALDGSDSDRRVVVEHTNAVMDGNPWVNAYGSTL